MPTSDQVPDCVPDAAKGRVLACPFREQHLIEALEFRESAYFHTLLVGRHIGVHRPDGRICNWTARILTTDKRYIQKCLGPALPLGRGQVSYLLAIERAFDWFETLKSNPSPMERGPPNAQRSSPFAQSGRPTQ